MHSPTGSSSRPAATSITDVMSPSRFQLMATDSVVNECSVTATCSATRRLVSAVRPAGAASTIAAHRPSLNRCAVSERGGATSSTVTSARGHVAAFAIEGPGGASRCNAFAMSTSSRSATRACAASASS